MASILCVTGGSLLGLFTPLILKWIIDQIIPQRDAGLLLWAVALIFLGYQGRLALTGLGSYAMFGAAQKMALRLRLELLRHLNTLSAEYYENTPVGTLIYPFKESIEEVSHFVSDFLPIVLRMFLTVSFTVVTMFFLSPVLTLTVVPLVPVFLIARQHFRERLGKVADTVQSDQVAWSKFLEEHLSCMIPIQLLSQERRQERRAFRLLLRSLRSQQKQLRTGIWFSTCSSLAIVVAVCAVVGYGGERALKGTLSIGSLVAFYGFVAQLFEPLSVASELYAKTHKTFASVRLLQTTLALRPTVSNSGAAICLSHGCSARINFAAVEFGHRRQADMLDIPALRIFPGEHVAIGGENGAGKSTLAKLMARFYDPARGSIFLEGEDIRNLELRKLRQYVCYLPHSPALFDGTLASNLRFAQPGASDHELQQVLECAGLWPFVATLPDGFLQRIGPAGCQLSGGQRQRLAVARALLQKPRVLILDEATSCLDPCSEILVLRNIRRHLLTSTVVFISHRVSTLSTFERVVTLSRGRIVADGVCSPLVVLEGQLPDAVSRL